MQYRVGDVLLPASGTFAADSGRSIFLEQHVEQKGKRSYFRWEIPYQFIHRIEAIEESQPEPAPAAIDRATPETLNESQQAATARAGAGVAPSTGVPLISLPQRPKTA